MTEEQDKVELDLEEVMNQQLAKFGLSFEDLPKSKQEELEKRMNGIAKSDDLKKGAVEQLRKALA